MGEIADEIIAMYEAGHYGMPDRKRRKKTTVNEKGVAAPYQQITHYEMPGVPYPISIKGAQDYILLESIQYVRDQMPKQKDNEGKTWATVLLTELEKEQECRTKEGIKKHLKWKTQDGREYLLPEMENTHVHNSVLWLRRQIAIEGEDSTTSATNTRRTWALKELEREIKRRGLPEPLLPIKSLTYRRMVQDGQSDN